MVNKLYTYKFLDKVYDISKYFSIFKLLQNIYGLSGTSILHICSVFGFSIYSSPLVIKNFKLLESYIAKHFCIDRALKKNIFFNKQEKKKMGSYVSIRISQNLPTRGQRTKTNAKTSKKIKNNI